MGCCPISSYFSAYSSGITLSVGYVWGQGWARLQEGEGGVIMDGWWWSVVAEEGGV